MARLGTERLAKEEKTRERLRSGELGLDFYGLRAKLAELGVQYVDEDDAGGVRTGDGEEMSHG